MGKNKIKYPAELYKKTHNSKRPLLFVGGVRVAISLKEFSLQMIFLSGWWTR